MEGQRGRRLAGEERGEADRRSSGGWRAPGGLQRGKQRRVSGSGLWRAAGERRRSGRERSRPSRAGAATSELSHEDAEVDVVLGRPQRRRLRLRRDGA
uniref:Uncharacterized protein n=1 Tax=Oryza glumipatula TaxID=40148 RepID=A0A0E0A0N7_9ORYZ